jgi:hypothetical protein
MLSNGNECEFCGRMDRSTNVYVYNVNGRPFDLHSHCAKRIRILRKVSVQKV